VPNTIDCSPRPPRDPMDSSIEEGKAALLMEYERLGTVDLGAWIGRYPQHRDELIDFWMWVKGTPREAEMNVGPFPATDSDVVEGAFRDACLAVNLGRQWLERPLDPSVEAIREMAVALEALRAQPRVKSGKAPVQFRKAVVWTWVVSIFQSQRPRVSRLAVQKATYLLDCAMNLGVFADHTRKQLGPYDCKARYEDAEPIAINKQWLKVCGATLSATDDLSEVSRFVGRYLRSKQLAQRLIDYLARLSDDELETLATVHWSARELIEAGDMVSVTSVRHTLACTPEWRPKLDRANFSLDRVGTALQQLKDLRLALPRSR
jgi:hypothetical protein